MRWKPAVTGCGSAEQAAVSAQGNRVPSTPLWQVKDLAGFTEGGGGALAAVPKPPRGMGRVNYSFCMHCHPP